MSERRNLATLGGAALAAAAALLAGGVLAAARCPPLVAPPAPATPLGSATPAARAAPRAYVTVRLAHLPGDEGWSVLYRFPHPVPAARFVRRGYGLRQAHWRVESPGVRLEARGDRDFLVAPEGGLLDEVRVRIAPFATKPEKDYQAFIPYAEGGVLAYTGHLNVDPEPDVAPGTEIYAGDHDVLLPRAGEHVVVLGKRYEGTAEPPDDLDGTYAFFGSVAPVQSGRLIAVVDPGMPPWLRRTMEDLLPRVFALYAEHTGHALSFDPTVFMSYGDESQPTALSIGGGTLRGLLQLEVRLGSRWRAEGDPFVRERVLLTVAHEAAHMWIGQMFSTQAAHGDWMFEGGADAFAYRALRHLGLTSEPAYLAQLSAAASLCALGLGGEPLVEAHRPGRTKSFYHCGSTLQLIAEAAAHKGDARADAFTLWGHVFDAAGAGRRYDDRIFFEALVEGGVPAPRIERLRALVERPDPEIAETLARALREEGVEVEASCTGAPEDLAWEVAQRAVRHALAQTCAEARLLPEKDSLAVVPPGACPALGAGARIATVDGRSVVRDPFDAYAALSTRCAASGTVALGLVGAPAPVRVPCGPLVPARPPCLQIRRAP